MLLVSILYVRPYSMALPVLSAASKNLSMGFVPLLIFAREAVTAYKECFPNVKQVFLL